VRAGEMVASPVPQSAGPADQGGAAVPSEHRGHERAVPSESLTAMTLRLRRMDVVTMFAAVAVIAAVSAALRLWLHLMNPTIAALSYLLVVLGSATVSTLPVAIAVSAVADLFLNYFFLPPLGTFVIADPENWVALFAFLAVSVVASNLSTAARQRARDAVARRDELAQLLDERKAAEAARQHAEFKSALLAALAHDLRTPLTAI